MPGTVQQSSSEGFVFFKHSQLASRVYPEQPQVASLPERPASVLPTPQPVAGSKGGQRPLRGVVQEKGLLTQALKASEQPGLSADEPSPQTMCSNGHRSQSRALPPVKLVHSTFWLDPRVRAELEREAKDRGIPFSQMGAIACRDWVRYEINRQQTSLFEEKLRHIVREEIHALRDNLVVFELKNACVSEQSRIIMTDLYKRYLKHTGMSLEQFYQFLDQSDEMAKENILKRSPKFTELLAQWEAAQAANRKEDKTN
jgi:hypothetical protein